MIAQLLKMRKQLDAERVQMEEHTSVRKRKTVRGRGAKGGRDQGGERLSTLFFGRGGMLYFLQGLVP